MVKFLNYPPPIHHKIIAGSLDAIRLELPDIRIFPKTREPEIKVSTLPNLVYGRGEIINLVEYRDKSMFEGAHTLQEMLQAIIDTTQRHLRVQFDQLALVKFDQEQKIAIPIARANPEDWFAAQPYSIGNLTQEVISTLLNNRNIQLMTMISPDLKSQLAAQKRVPQDKIEDYIQSHRQELQQESTAFLDLLDHNVNATFNLFFSLNGETYALIYHKKETFPEHIAKESGLAYMAQTVTKAKLALLTQWMRENERAEADHTIHEVMTQLVSKIAAKRDNETANHNKRVGEMFKVIINHLFETNFNGVDCPEEEKNRLRLLGAELLGRAAELHDIGKITIPDHILHNTQKRIGDMTFTDADRQIMQSHAALGRQYFIEILDQYREKLEHSPVAKSYFQTVADIAGYHHERYDGTGYPEHLQGNHIPLVARIMILIDIFDALLSERPYKPAWSLQKTLGLIEAETGKHFDPVIAAIFNQHLDEINAIRDALQDEKPPVHDFTRVDLFWLQIGDVFHRLGNWAQSHTEPK